MNIFNTDVEPDIIYWKTFLTRDTYIQEANYKFPDVFCMDTFIDSTQMKLYSLSK